MKQGTRTALALATGIAAGVLIAPQTAQAVVNYFNTTKAVIGTGTVACPTGYRVTGGGFYGLPNDAYYSTSNDTYQLNGSYPYGNGWRVSVTRTHGVYNASTQTWNYANYSYGVRAFAICAT